MSLYTIIKSLQTTQGSNAKLAILEANKDNELLKSYMKAMLDPAINYYITKVPKVKPVGRQKSFDMVDIQHAINTFAMRQVTGNDAKKCLLKWLEDQASEQDQELIEYLIKRKIDGANVGETMVLKTWPGLFFIPPYQRCSLMDDNIKAKFEAFPEFFIQTKMDGSFAYLITGDQPALITRAGSKYPEWMVDRLIKNLPPNVVLVGEMEAVSKLGRLDRQTGNGVLNSVLHDAEEKLFDHINFKFTAWDLLSIEDFLAEKSLRRYEYRLLDLEISIAESGSVFLVNSWVVKSLQEAYKIYSEHTAVGMEGCVIKSPDSLWKDGTAKDVVKLKVRFQADYVIEGFYEGEGKASAMLGGLCIASSDGKIISNVGSGFTDAMRKSLWKERDTLVGKIITVEANDVVSNKNNPAVKSLFLPVLLQIRLDKTKADSYDRVMEQLEDSKNGV